MREKSRMDWWREARFGMFIHWGVYAVPAGVWQGEDVPGIGEWIMKRARIPVAEYEKLAEQFNPVRFDAEEWVRIAKDAGMRYIVITSKHHDGFAMFGSRCSSYDITDATPFGRDLIGELANACARHGLRLCFYYSHVQDWHHPDAVGNDWDFDESQKDFARYLERKAKPQVRELLTQYGPIGLIWYDTPMNISEQHSREMLELVYELQPDCLVNSRVGNGLGDYQSRGDNEVPPGVAEGDWETPATMNDTWGFKTKDENWKPVGTLLRLLVNIVSKGGNYLLNVGPTAEGLIPAASVERLRAMGEWLKANGDAIYGSSASPFPCEFEWGAITTRDSRLYLHLFEWPEGRFRLYGLVNDVRSARLLSGGEGGQVAFRQDYSAAAKHHSLELELPPTAPDENVSVVVLELDGPPQVDPMILQQPDGTVLLEAFLADMHTGSDSPPTLGRGGGLDGWTSERDWLSWEFKVVEPGTFDVELLSATRWHGEWNGGHQLRIDVAGQNLQFTVQEDDRRADRGSLHYWQNVVTQCGRVELGAGGTGELTVRAADLHSGTQPSLRLRGVRLVRFAE